MIKVILLKSIKIYQRIFSFDQGVVGKIIPVRLCRFYPTCSEYTYQAVQKHGVFKGGLKGIKRIGRCHPFNKGGFDPID